MRVEFIRPKIYLVQYLLIPIRLVLFLPLALGFLLFLNAVKTVVGVSGLAVLFCLGWLVDSYFWPGFLNSRIAGLLFVLLIVPTYYLIFSTLGRIFDSSEKPSTQQTTKRDGLYDRLFSFVFEAKYCQPYIELYGPDFPKPEFETFGLKAEDYYSYNRSFSFSGLKSPLTILTGLAVGYIASNKIPPPQHFIVGILAAICVGSALLAFDQIRARAYPQHNKVQAYNSTKRIYDSIQTELRKAALK